MENNQADMIPIGIIGAGPIGLELAIALKHMQIPYIQFDKGQVAQTIFQFFPPQTHFFSSNEKISLSNFPIQTVDQQKCTREEYLAYLRSLALQHGLDINTYEEVTDVKSLQDGFEVITPKKNYQVKYLVFATGGLAFPRLLKVPGENLPHVAVTMEEPHKYFQKKVVIVGGKNSAAENALRCYHAGAKVTLVTKEEEFSEKSVKYWLLPELLGLIAKRHIRCFYKSEVLEILADKVVIRHDKERMELDADFIIKAIGFEADMSLLSQLGVSLKNGPNFNEETMETSVPGVYVAGTVIGGTQKKFEHFIENCHAHVDKLAAVFSKLFGRPKPLRITRESPKSSLEE